MFWIYRWFLHLCGASLPSDTLALGKDMMSGVEQGGPHEVVHHVARVVGVVRSSIQVVLDQLVLHAHMHIQGLMQALHRPRELQKTTVSLQ